MEDWLNEKCKVEREGGEIVEPKMDGKWEINVLLFWLFRLAAAQEAAAQHAENEERRNRSGGVLGFGHLPYLGASSRSSFLGDANGSPSAAGMGTKRSGGAAASSGSGPTSLFILTEKNFLRRYTRFIIEWPYPFHNSIFHPFIKKKKQLKINNYLS